MTLSGNLGFVPLDEVLRLLTRAGNDGMVEITNSTASGRIYVVGKGISLATTLSDTDLKDHLAASGYITRNDLDRVEAREASLGDFFGEGSEGTALLREMTVESIYRLNATDADFEVIKDETSPFIGPNVFDLEGVLGDSRDRADEWARVLQTIPDLGAVLRINRHLDRETIELNRDSWRIVGQIGTGSSVREMAAGLGTTEFAVASVAADMARDELLVVADGPAGQEDAPVTEDAFADYDFNTDVEPAEESVDAHDRSWWDEPETEEKPSAGGPARDFASFVAGDFEGAESDDEPAVDASSDVGDADTESEETEAFLEKVFSDLGPAGDSDDGHGLMRRRRMGSILRDLGED